MYKIFTRILCTQQQCIHKFLLVMKLTTFIIMIAILQVSASGFAQKITLTQKNISLEQVFREIHKQTGYNVLYSATKVEQLNSIDVDFKNTPLIDALDKIFQTVPLTYEIEEKNVIVKEKETSYIDQLKDKLKAAMASVTVRGQVIDETNQPMSGVTVKEKGTNNVTATDSKGYFSLIVSNADAIVAFSYIGYETKELSTKDLPKGVVIMLVAANTNLREVVINKGYYDEKAALSTADVSVVSAKEIEEQPVGDPMMALEAKVPGLNIVQNSGVPGSNFTILLRGVNSLANGNSPLFIIDGVPFSSNTLTPGAVGGGALNTNSIGSVFGQQSGMSPFNALNQDDIESITVLKDADALSIYGSRGANGVILITTKKGHAGNTTINFDISQGDSKDAHFMDLMNTRQYLQMRHEAYALDGITTIPSNAYDVNGVWDTTRNTNWQKVLLGGTAQNTNAQLSVSGGTENTQFYIGSGVTRQTTVFPGNFGDDKASLNFNLTHTSADKRFQIQFSAGYTHDNNNVPSIDLTNLALTLAPDAPALYKSDGSLNWQEINGTSTWTNPLHYTAQTTEGITNNLTSHMDLSYRILPGLNLAAGLGYGDDELKQTNLFPATEVVPPPYNLPQLSQNNFGNTEFTNWIIEPKITYDGKISDGKLNVVLGASVQQNYSTSEGFSATDFTSDALIANPSNAGNFQFDGLTDAEYRYIGGYARIGYSWEDKYLLNLTANRDGSSRFGPGKQWGDFGAIGAGWVFSKEKFVENNLSWLSFGKLRGSYGTTGNDQINDYQFLDSYSTNSSTYLGTTELFPTRIANADYSWEVDKKLEGGLELGFLKDRINFTASYYINRTSNQLVGYTLPGISGFTSVEANLPAVIQNTGLEITLRSVNFQSGAFRWTTLFNLTVPENKLVAFSGFSSSSYANIYTLGQSLFVAKTFKYAGVNPADGVYEDASGGVPSESPNYPNDLVLSPALTQKWYSSLTNSFSYKGFQLDFSLQIVKQIGYNYWSGGALLYAGAFNYNEPVELIGNTWDKPDDHSEFGRLSTVGASNASNAVYSTFALTDASFIRLKNAALSYNLPQSWQKNLHLKNARIYIDGENLLTFTNYFGLDPESGSLNLPSLRTIVVGIHTSF